MTAQTSDVPLNSLHRDASKDSTPHMQHTQNRSGGHKKVVQDQPWCEKTAKHSRLRETGFLFPVPAKNVNTWFKCGIPEYRHWFQACALLPLSVFWIKPLGNTLSFTDADARASIDPGRREKQAGNNRKQVKTSRRINVQEVVELAIDFWRNHEIENKGEGTKEQGVTVTLCLKGGKKKEGCKVSNFQKETPLLRCGVLYGVRKCSEEYLHTVCAACSPQVPTAWNRNQSWILEGHHRGVRNRKPDYCRDN